MATTKDTKSVVVEDIAKDTGTEDIVKGVSIDPSSFQRGTLKDLLVVFKRAPEADSTKMHSLDLKMWDAVSCVGSALNIASHDNLVGRGKQELSRYVMLDVARIASECKELQEIKESIKRIRDLIKNNKSRTVRRDMMGEMERSVTYFPLTLVAPKERYHLWAWDDTNLKTLTGILSDTELPKSVLTAFAAGSLATLGTEILGEYVEELEDECKHCFSKIGLYLDRLLSLEKWLT